MMNLVRVDLNRLEITKERLSNELKSIGGRALCARILNQEVPSDTDPLGAQSKIILASGPLAGTRAPSCGRLSIGAKSPLTYGIKEANTGGPAGQKLDRLGVRAVVIEGAANRDQPCLLKISRGEMTLESAKSYQQLGNYELSKELRKQYPGKASIISIGPAGERGWKAAAVTLTDKDGRSSRHAARGGLGAVLGAKGVKAIIIDDGMSENPEIADKAAFRSTIKDWVQTIKSDKQIFGIRRYGTPGSISILSWLGSMPIKNYSSEALNGVEKISGESIRQINLERGGKMVGCMPGCPVKCSIVYHDSDNQPITSSLEYQTIALLGTNLGITDLDIIAKLDYLADNLGIDAIELGSSLGVAASAGKIKMGDAQSIFGAMKEIEEGTEFGSILGNGVVETCKALDVKRIPAYKGQAIPAHDPRIAKPAGVTYATSPMGADHTVGISYEKYHTKSGQVKRSLESQILNTVWDAFGFCQLSAPQDKSLALAYLRDLTNARFGIDLTVADLVEIGKETLKQELKFNQNSGFYSVHEAEPGFIRNEPAGPRKTVFDIESSEIESLWNKLDSFTYSDDSRSFAD